MKKGIQKGAEKAIEKSAEKAGNFVANKAGDKIVQLLSKQNKASLSPEVDSIIVPTTNEQKLSDFGIAARG